MKNLNNVFILKKKKNDHTQIELFIKIKIT